MKAGVSDSMRKKVKKAVALLRAVVFFWCNNFLLPFSEAEEEVSTESGSWRPGCSSLPAPPGI